MGRSGKLIRTGEGQDETEDGFTGEAGGERSADESWNTEPDTAVESAEDNPAAKVTTPMTGEDG